MELAHVAVAPRTSASSDRSTGTRPPIPSSPAELHDLVAAENAAATISPGADYAIWESACRQLLPEPRPTGSAPVVSPPPKTVLVIESAPALLETMNRSLDAAGYNVLSSTDGAKALGLAREQKADLIVTDLDLAAMDGIALIAQLRELPGHRLTPIMMLMTPAQEARRIAGRHAGASGWIGKPFDPQRFIAIVQKVCPAI